MSLQKLTLLRNASWRVGGGFPRLASSVASTPASSATASDAKNATKQAEQPPKQQQQPAPSQDPRQASQPAPAQQLKKTQAQLDEELREKMSGLSGDGGESGVEYEDGQPVAMKRSVKSNMFRYI